jgi:hypothetical protein
VDDQTSAPDPEVTIEPADNGYIVRHYQRGTGKDQQAVPFDAWLPLQMRRWVTQARS